MGYLRRSSKKISFYFIWVCDDKLKIISDSPRIYIKRIPIWLHYTNKPSRESLTEVITNNAHVKKVRLLSLRCRRKSHAQHKCIQNVSCLKNVGPMDHLTDQPPNGQKDSLMRCVTKRNNDFLLRKLKSGQKFEVASHLVHDNVTIQHSALHNFTSPKRCSLAT